MILTKLGYTVRGIDGLKLLTTMSDPRGKRMAQRYLKLKAGSIMDSDPAMKNQRK